jgi:YD repeat-containing protein
MKTHTHTHTPGPWSVETKGSRHFIDGADELTVAYVDRAGVRERQTYEANAQLIAAAPDLLEALEDAAFLMRMAAKIAGPMQDSFKRSAEDAAKALAKAEGIK